MSQRTPQEFEWEWEDLEEYGEWDDETEETDWDDLPDYDRDAPD